MNSLLAERRNGKNNIYIFPSLPALFEFFPWDFFILYKIKNLLKDPFDLLVKVLNMVLKSEQN